MMSSTLNLFNVTFSWNVIWDKHNSFAGYSIIQKIKKHNTYLRPWSTTIAGYLLIRVEDTKILEMHMAWGAMGSDRSRIVSKHKHKSKDKEKREKEKQPKDKQSKERNVCFDLCTSIISFHIELIGLDILIRLTKFYFHLPSVVSEYKTLFSVKNRTPRNSQQ